MTQEESRRDEALRWLRLAARDCNGARFMAVAEPSLSVFHSQQAVEKALKGFLAYRGQVFRRTHDLEELGAQCLKSGAYVGSGFVSDL